MCEDKAEKGIRPSNSFIPLFLLVQDADKLAKYRSVELKHGRVAMLGVLGIWIQAAGTFLGFGVGGWMGGWMGGMGIKQMHASVRLCASGRSGTRTGDKGDPGGSNELLEGGEGGGFGGGGG